MHPPTPITPMTHNDYVSEQEMLLCFKSLRFADAYLTRTKPRSADTEHQIPITKPISILN